MLSLSLSLCLSSAPAANGVAVPPPPPASGVVTIYVATNGDDNNPGTQLLPKRTPQGGLDAVRRGKTSNLDGQFIVQFAAGKYFLAQTFQLTSADAALFGQPLIFRGAGPGVYFDGSRQVAGWQKVSGSVALRFSPAVRDKVFVAGLPLMLDGSTMDVGVMNRRGFPYSTTQTWSSLVFNDTNMTLARYPNSGWLTVPSNHGGSTTSMTFTDPEPFKWKNTGDIWAHGYFGNDWSDSFERVQKFDRLMQRLLFATQPYYGIKKNQRYYLLNAMEAVDSANEYYIDRVARKVYFYPPLDGYTDAQKIASLNAGSFLTSLDEPLVEAYDTADINFENITFQNGRRGAVSIKYGARIAFNGCTFRRFGTVAAQALSGTDHSFNSCDFYDLDEGGVTLQGGDRNTLTPGGHLVENCWFHDYSEVCRTYRAAIDLWGVGCKVSHSRVEDAPHQGIAIHGNNHVIEYTDFARLCQETTDAGAVYINRNVTQQGNKVWYNRFTDLWSNQQSALSNFVVGVYMDDMASGTEVSFNYFDNVQFGAVVGGGRDNIVDNNEFHNMGKAAMFDARGTSWASNFWTSWNVPAMLAEVPYTGVIWRAAYPKLANYVTDSPSRPKRNILTNNVYFGSSDWLLLNDGLTLSDTLVGDPAIYAANNRINSAQWLFDLPATSSRGGGNRIDEGLIGLYYNQWRTYVP